MFPTTDLQLLVHLHVVAPTVCAHLWPARFADEGTVDNQSLNGFYLIGLSSLTAVPKEQHIGNVNIKSAVTNALSTFERDIQSNAQFYDPADMFIFVTTITAPQLPRNIVLDTHQWSDAGFDDEEDEDNLVDAAETTDDQNAQEYSPSASKKKQAKSKQATPNLPARKLRTSSDVYNRLVWDPAVSKEDYVIGYEDRFKGLMEMPLSSWKREVEDESFVSRFCEHDFW